MDPSPADRQSFDDRRTSADPIQHPLDASGAGHIAELVASYRRRRGLSQRDLGIAIGWSERTIRRLERGELDWVRAVERGAQPRAEELRVLRALATELRLELDALIRPPDVVAPAALASPPPLVPEVVAPPEPPRQHSSLADALARLQETPPSRRQLGWPRCAGRRRLLVAAAAGGALATSAGMAYAMTAVIHLPFSWPHTTTIREAAAQTPDRARRSPRRPPATMVTPAPVPAVIPPPAAVAVAPPPPAPPAPAADLPVHRAAPMVRVAAPVGPIATFSTKLIDFGHVAVGSSVSRSVTLTNTGDRPLQVSQTTLLWADEVAITDDSCAGHTLAPRQRCSVTLTYSPTKDGMLAPFPQLGFVDNAPGYGGGQVVELRGDTE